MADFQIVNHGSIVVITPLSEAGEQWREEHISADALSWGRGFVCEPRYVADIVEGIESDGLEFAA